MVRVVCHSDQDRKAHAQQEATTGVKRYASFQKPFSMLRLFSLFLNLAMEVSCPDQNHETFSRHNSADNCMLQKNCGLA
jgi:hypothetical protein